MSEMIGVNIEIGGELPVAKIGEFLKILNDDISDINTGPTDEEGLRNEAGKDPIKWYGIANYGLAKDLTNFCKDNKLSYIFMSDAKYEYDAQKEFWTPDRKYAVTINCTQDGTEVVRIDLIKPVVDLMLAYVQNPSSAPAKFLGDERYSELLSKLTKRPKRAHAIFQKTLDDMMPTEPKLPPFTIKE